MSDPGSPRFQAIAVVGRGCILPGCQTVDDLWRIIDAGSVQISSASGDDWRVCQARLTSETPGKFVPDRMWSNSGGYVRDFADHFDGRQFQLDADLIDRLDPVFLWSLEAARQALAELQSTAQRQRTGVVLGNLSYPTRGHSQFAEEVWLQQMRGKGQVQSAAENRFMSGLPAMLIAQGLGLGGNTLALDAACASGLYAIKIACDRLQDGRADLMLAGGVNAADPLFIHMGFCALNALSKTGDSRPFHRDADGLVPAEGAAFVALKRLADARKEGDRIYGVIRGIGLSNDGRSGGFLSPSSAGQVRCMQQAYAMADLDPADVQFIECHATGTVAGDAAELASLSEIFPRANNLPLGSLKGNLGHLITTSGVAGLLKVLLAFEHRTIPATPNAAPSLPALAAGGFQVPAVSAAWASENPRLAAVNSFGFGGNNAHLLVQEDSDALAVPVVSDCQQISTFAIVSLAVRTLQDNQIQLGIKSLAFPPADLKEALGQQLILLDLLPEVLPGIAATDGARTGIFIGMQTDSEVCRYGLRWRLPDLDPDGFIANADSDIIASLNAAGVIGKMPNVTANRLSNQLNITGPGYTVSREELSGDAALELAMTGIQRNELDAAIVGAVDLANEQVHAAAMAKIAPDSPPTSNAAVLLVIKSVELAEADGDQILALIERADNAGLNISDNTAELQAPNSPVGAHAAEGLLNIAACIQQLQAGLSQMSQVGGGSIQEPILICNRSRFGETSAWELRQAAEESRASDQPLLEIYAADERASLLANIKSGTTGGKGPCRVALVGRAENLKKLRDRAVQGIASNNNLKHWSLDGVSYSAAPVTGEMAFVFTGAASAYPDMGRDLFRQLPGICSDLADRMPEAADAMAVASDQTDSRYRLPFYQLAGSSYLSQLHVSICRDLLDLKPQAAIGLSSGETNAMFAFGAWQDMDSLLRDIDATELYRSALAAEFASVRAAWNLSPNESVEWVNLRVLAPVAEVRRAIEDQDRVYLTIIQTDRDCVIGGQRLACESLLQRLGNPETIPLGHDLAVHCDVVAPFESAWRTLHTRKTTTPEAIRFYSSYLDGAYEVSEASVADALTGQALQTINFPRIIDAAWNDGVRLFVELGPRNSLGSAIDEILGDRLHLAVSLDHAAVPSMTQLYRAVATLWCAGVNIDLSGLDLNQPAPDQQSAATIAFRLRLPDIERQVATRAVTDEITSADVYVPPVCTAGPAEGRLLPPAPALARTIAAASVVTRSGVSESAHSVKESAHSVPESTAEIDKHPAPARSATPRVTSSDSSPAGPVCGTPMGAVPAAHQLLIAGHQQMLQAHQAFLSDQMAGQRAFADTMARMQANLLGITGSVPETVPPPAAVIPPVVVEPPQPLAETPTGEIDSCAEEPVNRPGPSFSRQQLEVLTSGKISSEFGPLFEQQDQYDVQVRMPEPPLLLCDRVLGIDGEAGSMGLGTIWTETDVRQDSWYLHHGRMPAGIFIESGQADLLLISWLGIDFHNRGERAYRLLGCDLVFHGDLPQPGETLEYEIQVDGHAQQGDVRLFFFHYDCHINGELRISVRNGQAGFFTPEELADSAGILWDAGTADYTQGFEAVAAVAHCQKDSFSRAEIAAYLEGDLQKCFGAGFARAHTHTRTPRSPAGRGNFLGEVSHYDPTGGPAGRGYLRIVEDIHPDDWFFDGHFKNDPCMPGTLMADACLQAMAFYMSARGHTLFRDGWRFQPVRSTTYKFICRGQVTPDSRQLVYEIFVDAEIIDDQPKLFAHVLCSVDGRKAFLCERLGLELVPDWPLSSMPELLAATADDRPLADINGFPLDYRALISCAWGQPSLAFGAGFAHYDGPLRSPRLPGPPYHFMTRITALDGEMASMKAGGRVEVLYDIPADAWYFAENGSPTMPYCVLMEIGLQPCGWLASYTLGRDHAASDLLFRNLDGTAVQHREIAPGEGTLKTSANLTSISRVGELIIESFDVVCSIKNEPVFTMKTVFGFFPPDAMANQKGLPISEHERLIFAQPANTRVDLVTRPAPYFDHPAARLPDSRLLMLDRITFLDADGGHAGLGCIRGEKDVDVTEWFFKAHFFQDPVQPGSLGIEAMLQLMQAFMLSQDMHQGFRNPAFEPILIAAETEWHYRGQVTPEKDLITLDFACAERGTGEGACWILGEARLWVDGLKIYHAAKIGMRIIEAAETTQAGAETQDAAGDGTWRLDLESSPWIRDHCPTYTVPSLPMMVELDLMAQAVIDKYPGLKVVGIPRADARSWLAFQRPGLVGFTEVEDQGDGLVGAKLFGRDAATGQAELAASGQIRLAAKYPVAPTLEIESLQNGVEIDAVYQSGELFHGPAFQLLRELQLGTNGASGILDLDRNGVPVGVLNPGLLDAALHCIPHDRMQHWHNQIPAGQAAYPLKVEDLHLYGSLPTTGLVQVEARCIDVRAGRFPRTRIWLLRKEQLLAEFTLTEVLMPKGPLGTLPPLDRRAFLADKAFVAEAGLTDFDGQVTTARDTDVLASNWLPGTLEQVYGLDPGATDLIERVAAAEHGGRILRLHPSQIQLNNEGVCRNVPLNDFSIKLQRAVDSCTASGSVGALQWRQISAYWTERSGGEQHLVHDLFTALIRKFLRRFIVTDPADFAARAGQPAIYLANHQVGVESFLFLSMIATLTGIPAEAVAKKEHRDTWIGRIYQLAETELAGDNPLQMLFFDRQDQADMLGILNHYGETVIHRPRSLLVHVDGTRATQAGQPTQKVSSVLIDLAVKHGIPIVPVRFAGGLAIEESATRLEFPVGFGGQDYYIGAAIEPDQLQALPYADRARRVLAAINNLGPGGQADLPVAADNAFARVAASLASDRSEVQGVLLAALQTMPDLGAGMQKLLQALASGNAASEKLSPAEIIAVDLLGL